MCEGKSKPPTLEEFIPVVMEQPLQHYQKQMIRALAQAAEPLILAFGHMSCMPELASPYDVRHVSLKEYVESATPKYFDPTSIQKSRGKRKQKRY